MLHPTPRIAILDGFRALAILAVALFHYFSSWSKMRNGLLPYGDSYDHFAYGYLGVQFFFIISGFVIFSTLERTATLKEFLFKRFIRLWPALLVASVLTYLLISFFDSRNFFPESASLKNLLLSLTFLHPNILNNLGMSEFHFNFVSGSYWSLWPEIQFYLLAGICYYVAGKRFLPFFLTISAGVCALHFIAGRIQSGDLTMLSPQNFDWYTVWIRDCFNIPDYISFFCCGLLFYSLYNHKNRNVPFGRYRIAALIFFMGCTLYPAADNNIRLIYLGMFALFFVFIYLPQYLRFLEMRWITMAGEGSYFFYLIHEICGLILISLLASFFNPPGLLVLLVIVLMIVLSIIYTKLVDPKLRRLLKREKLQKEPLSA
jgi:peptidoglycan/LPS O-acetylase OafA/YrhL